MNVCDIYNAVAGQDAVGGATFTYPLIPTMPRVACSAQPVETTEVLENDRITQHTLWEVMFPATTNTNARDKLVITDSLGVQHTAFVHAEQDQAGRGAAFVVYAIEIL